MKNNRLAGKREGQKGFIKIIVIVVIALLVLSYFGFSLRNLVSQPTTQDNFSYATTVTVNFWNNYLAKPAAYVWHVIFLNLIWNPAMSQLQHLDKVDMTATTTPF